MKETRGLWELNEVWVGYYIGREDLSRGCEKRRLVRKAILQTKKEYRQEGL
jgi:hypothetical protein